MLRIREHVKAVEKVALEHYQELQKPVYGYSGVKKMIVFYSRNLESQPIHGGLADRDTDVFYGIDESGWVKYTITIEFGCRTNGGDNFFNTISDNLENVSVRDIEEYLNCAVTADAK